MGFVVLAGGGKRTIFIEEALHLSDQICRQILFFLQRNQPSQPESTAVISLFQRKSEYLVGLIVEQQSFKAKLGDLNQVPLYEINDVARNHNDERFAGLSIQQRQAIYVKKIQEVILYIGEKVDVMFSELTVTGPRGLLTPFHQISSNCAPS